MYNHVQSLYPLAWLCNEQATLGEEELIYQMWDNSKVRICMYITLPALLQHIAEAIYLSTYPSCPSTRAYLFFFNFALVFYTFERCMDQWVQISWPLSYWTWCRNNYQPSGLQLLNTRDVFWGQISIANVNLFKNSLTVPNDSWRLAYHKCSTSLPRRFIWHLDNDRANETLVRKQQVPSEIPKA